MSNVNLLLRVCEQFSAGRAKPPFFVSLPTHPGCMWASLNASSSARPVRFLLFVTCSCSPVFIFLLLFLSSAATGASQECALFLRLIRCFPLSRAGSTLAAYNEVEHGYNCALTHTYACMPTLLYAVVGSFSTPFSPCLGEGRGFVSSLSSLVFVGCWGSSLRLHLFFGTLTLSPSIYLRVCVCVCVFVCSFSFFSVLFSYCCLFGWLVGFT